MKPPPFVASLRFEAFLRVLGSATTPLDDAFPMELRVEWSIEIHGSGNVFRFPQDLPFRTDLMLAAFTPKAGRQLLLDYSDEDSSLNVDIEVVEHDTRTIAWRHMGLRGLARRGFAPRETETWEMLPDPIYFRKLHNRHLPLQFAHAISQIVRAFPGRVQGAYTAEMQKAISNFTGEQMPPPFSQ
jgi:hypothetical protein